MVTVKINASLFIWVCVSDCGIDDLLLADCARWQHWWCVKAFLKNPVSESGLKSESESQAQTAIIALVIQQCNFPTDSVIAKYIDQTTVVDLLHSHC
jgi:hypothetical protein